MTFFFTVPPRFLDQKETNEQLSYVQKFMGQLLACSDQFKIKGSLKYLYKIIPGQILFWTVLKKSQDSKIPPCPGSVRKNSLPPSLFIFLTFWDNKDDTLQINQIDNRPVRQRILLWWPIEGIVWGLRAQCTYQLLFLSWF